MRPDRPQLDPLRIGRMEELRQAKGVAEVSDCAEPIMGGMMCYSGPGSWTNQACALALDGPATDAEIDRLVAFYADRGQEPRVELAPFAHQSLVDGLADRGFRLIEFETVFARCLTDHDLAPLAPGPARIRTVDPSDPDDVANWVRVSSSGFVRADDPNLERYLESSRRMAAHPRVTAMMAEVGTEPVGAGAVEFPAPDGGESLASLIVTSVVPEYRRRGIQKLLMQARLAEARRRGASYATVHTRPGIATERNARRLGFETMYTKVVLVLRRDGLARSV